MIERLSASAVLYVVNPVKISESVFAIFLKRVQIVAVWLVSLSLTAASAFAAARESDPLADTAPAEVVAFDFVENLFQVSTDRDTFDIDFGRLSHRSYLRRGWGGDEGSESGRSFVWATEKSVEVGVIVWEVYDRTVLVDAAPFKHPGLPAQTMRILVNGQPVGAVRMSKVFTKYSFAAPASCWHLGENLLSFEFGFALSPASLSDGSGDPRPLAAQFDSLKVVPADTAPSRTALVIGGETREAIVQPVPGQIDYYLQVPAGAKLSFAYSPVPVSTPTTRTDMFCDISITPDLGMRTIVFAAPPFADNRPSTGWVDREVDLSDFGGQIVRVTFRTESMAYWTEPRIVVAGQPVKDTQHMRELPDGESAGSENRRSNVLIYVIDALRADHVGVFGYERDTTPNIDRFAEEATVFETALSNATWTKASVATMLTGLYPPSHLAISKDDALGQSATTLAEILRSEGHDTAAFVANVNLTEPFGFGQGFNELRYVAPSNPMAAGVQSGTLNKYVFSWLEERSRKPFFLYIHSMEPHEPYEPPETFRQRFRTSGTEEIDGTAESLKSLHTRYREEGLPRVVINDLLSLYDAEIAFSDASFYALLARMKAVGVYDNTIIILTADHGQEFWDHEGVGHGHNVFEEQIHVPLIVKLPGKEYEPRRVARPVGLVDLMPTVLDILGIEAPTPLEGTSFKRCLFSDCETEDEFDPIVYSGNFMDSSQHLSARTRKWKLIVNTSCRSPWADIVVPLVELYDLNQDPQETTNLAGEREILAQYLLHRVTFWLNGMRAMPPVAKPTKAVIDEELRQKLKALGYLD